MKPAVAAGLVAVIALSGLTLRTHRLGDRSLWEDELSTWTSIRGTVMDGIRYVQMPHPPLYALSCRLAAWGDPKPSETRLRMPAAVFGTLAALAGGWLGGVMFGRRVGWAALIVLTVNAFLVKYSREARMYSLLVLTTTVSMTCWYALITGRRRPWAWGAGYVLSTTAMLYTHYFAPLALAAQVVWVGLVERRRRTCARLAAIEPRPDGRGAEGRGSDRGGSLSRVLICLALPLAAFAPLAVFFVRHILPNKLGWIQPAPWWAYLHVLGDSVLGISEDVGAGPGAARWAHVTAGALVLAAVLATGAAWFAPVRGRRTGRPDAGRRNTGRTRHATTPCGEGDSGPGGLPPIPAGGLLMLLWVVFVVGGLGAISLISSPVFVPRYAITALVPGTLALLALPGIGRSRLIYALTAMLLAGNTPVAVTESLGEPAPNGLAGIIRHLNETLGPEDAVVVVDFPFCPNYRNPVQMGFEYYGLRSDLAVLRMRGEQKKGQLIESSALGDPRRLHIVTLLGDFDATLRATGRNVEIFALPPYRYFVVDRAADATRPPSFEP